jgi:exonuclease VII small subunit
MELAKKTRTAARGWLTRAVKKLQTVIDDEESDKIAYEDALAELNKRIEALEVAQANVEVATKDDEELNKEIEDAIPYYEQSQEVCTVAN